MIPNNVSQNVASLLEVSLKKIQTFQLITFSIQNLPKFFQNGDDENIEGSKRQKYRQWIQPW